MGFTVNGFGWWEYRRKVEEGEFVCPRERAPQRYRVMRSSRWITVLWLPIIPLGKRGLWVECRSCKGTFGLEVVTPHIEAANPSPVLGAIPESEPKPVDEQNRLEQLYQDGALTEQQFEAQTRRVARGRQRPHAESTPQAPAETVFCGDCGGGLAATAKFCKGCGAPQTEYATATSAGEQPLNTTARSARASGLHAGD